MRRDRVEHDGPERSADGVRPDRGPCTRSSMQVDVIILRVSEPAERGLPPKADPLIPSAGSDELLPRRG